MLKMVLFDFLHKIFHFIISTQFYTMNSQLDDLYAAWNCADHGAELSAYYILENVKAQINVQKYFEWDEALAEDDLLLAKEVERNYFNRERIRRIALTLAYKIKMDLSKSSELSARILNEDDMEVNMVNSNRYTSSPSTVISSITSPITPCSSYTPVSSLGFSIESPSPFGLTSPGLYPEVQNELIVPDLCLLNKKRKRNEEFEPCKFNFPVL